MIFFDVALSDLTRQFQFLLLGQFVYRDVSEIAPICVAAVAAAAAAAPALAERGIAGLDDVIRCLVVRGGRRLRV